VRPAKAGGKRPSLNGGSDGYPPSSKRPNMLAVLKLIDDMRIAQPSHRQVCYGRPAFFH
jgi:hypothetical protein